MDWQDLEKACANISKEEMFELFQELQEMGIEVQERLEAYLQRCGGWQN